MAEIISNPSNGNAGTLPANAGTIIAGSPQWGIDATLSGYIIQDISVAEERITDTTQDQKGAVVSQLDYDTHYTLTFTAIGGDGTEGSPTPLVPGQIDFTFLNKKWKVQSCTYTGNFQDKKKYAITAERWTNFPTQS